MAEGTDYTIGVKAIMDATSIKTETTSAEQAVEALEQAVETSADAMDTALDGIDASSVSTEVDTATDDVSAASGKMAGYGSEIGAEFSENLSEGFQSGDFVGVALETFASLTPAIGAAGIGLGAGALLVNQMLQGAEERKAEFVEAVNTMLDAVENDFKGTLEDIRADIEKSVTEIAVLEDLGGEEGLTGGLEKAREYAQGTGLALEDVVTLLQGDMTPAIRDVLREQQKQLDVVKDTELASADQYATMLKQESPAAQLLDLYRLQKDQLNQAKDDASDIFDVTHNMLDDQKVISDSAADHADAMERTADAAERWAAAIDRAIRAASSASADALRGLSF